MSTSNVLFPPSFSSVCEKKAALCALVQAPSFSVLCGRGTVTYLRHMPLPADSFFAEMPVANQNIQHPILRLNTGHRIKIVPLTRVTPSTGPSHAPENLAAACAQNAALHHARTASFETLRASQHILATLSQFS